MVIFWVKTIAHDQGAVDKMAVLLMHLSTYNGFLSICHSLEVSKVYRNSLAMLGSMVMYTVYTNTLTFGLLKLRLGH